MGLLLLFLLEVDAATVDEEGDEAVAGDDETTWDAPTEGDALLLFRGWDAS